MENSIGINGAARHAHSLWSKMHKDKGYVPPVERKTLSQALEEARRGLTRDQRRELLIETIFRGIDDRR